MYLSSKDFRYTSSPCTGVEALRPHRHRQVVNMYDPTTFGVDTEDIYGLPEFFRLEYNSLEDLTNKRSHGHPYLEGGGKVPLRFPQRRQLQSKLQLVGSCGKTLQRIQQPEHTNAQLTGAKKGEPHEQPYWQLPPFPWSPCRKPYAAMSSDRASVTCEATRCLPDRVPKSHVSQPQQVSRNITYYTQCLQGRILRLPSQLFNSFNSSFEGVGRTRYILCFVPSDGNNPSDALRDARLFGDHKILDIPCACDVRPAAKFDTGSSPFWVLDILCNFIHIIFK